MKKLLLIPIFVLLFETSAAAPKSPFLERLTLKESPGNLVLEQFKTRFSVAWGFDFISPTKIVLTERGGDMFVVDLNTGARKVVEGLPNISVGSQGGLLDVRVSPTFKADKTIFLSYSVANSEGRSTQIARAELVEGKKASLQNLKILFTAQPYFRPGVHFGSRIVFGNNNTLFFSVGDRGRRRLAQSLETDNGKIHRIFRDGKIPQDNPFMRNGKKSTIWSYGHRNPQGLFLEKSTGILWEQEHGPQGGDEINIIKKGANYGWPVVTYGEEYGGGKIGEGTNKKGTLQPKKYFVPSIAPSGLLVYSGKLFKPWKGWVFSGALALQHLNLVVRKGQKLYAEQRLFDQLGERFRNVREGPLGNIYFTTDRGGLYRLRYGKSAK